MGFINFNFLTERSITGTIFAKTLFTTEVGVTLRTANRKLNCVFRDVFAAPGKTSEIYGATRELK